MVAPLEYHPYITYLVRIRDALSGAERWLCDRKSHMPIGFGYRQNADLAALNESRQGANWEYAWVIEVDTRYESISALALDTSDAA